MPWGPGLEGECGGATERLQGGEEGGGEGGYEKGRLSFPFSFYMEAELISKESTLQTRGPWSHGFSAGSIHTPPPTPQPPTFGAFRKVKF